MAVQQSKYLVEALRQMAAPSRANPQSLAEALSRVGQAAFAKHGLNKAADAEEAKTAAEDAKRMELIQALSAGDPRMAAMLQLNPEAVTGSMAKAYEPVTMSGGQTRIVPGAGGGQETFMAPELGVSEGRGYINGPQGLQQTGTLDPSFGEQTGRMSVEETMRHNPVMEQLGQGQLGVSQGQLGVSQGQLGLAQQVHQARQAAGGYGTPGVGGVLGPQLGAGWEVIP